MISELKENKELNFEPQDIKFIDFAGILVFGNRKSIGLQNFSNLERFKKYANYFVKNYDSSNNLINGYSNCIDKMRNSERIEDFTQLLNDQIITPLKDSVLSFSKDLFEGDTWFKFNEVDCFKIFNFAIFLQLTEPLVNYFIHRGVDTVSGKRLKLQAKRKINVIQQLYLNIPNGSYTLDIIQGCMDTVIRNELSREMSENDMKNLISFIKYDLAMYILLHIDHNASIPDIFTNNISGFVSMYNNGVINSDIFEI
jgi:hypothetical protein